MVAAGERDALLPAARQRAGELAAAFRVGAFEAASTAAAAAPARRRCPRRSPGFVDGQVLVQAEALRHVADLRSLIRPRWQP